MAGYVGKDLYLAFAGTVLDTDFRTFSPSEEIGLVDQSAGADTGSTWLTTLVTGTAGFAIVIQAADTTTWGAIVPGTEGTLEWGEEGTAAGKPRHYVNAIAVSREKVVDYGDVVIANATFRYSQQTVVTDTTY